MALAETSRQLPRDDLAAVATAVVGLFITTQLTTTLLFRTINASLEHDYGAGYNSHYFFAALPVVAALVIDVVQGVSVAGPAFRLLLLGAGWRYTSERPTSVLRTFKLLRKRFRARARVSPG